MLRMEIRREVLENARQEFENAIRLINNQARRRMNGS
jgi:hypothetical protein